MGCKQSVVRGEGNPYQVGSDIPQEQQQQPQQPQPQPQPQQPQQPQQQQSQLSPRQTNGAPLSPSGRAGNAPLTRGQTNNVIGEVDIARPKASNTPVPTMADRPPVPEDSWYALPFSEHVNASVTEFHYKNKGRVVFSETCIPTRAAELEVLPKRSPPTCNTFTLGKVPIYGMAYLHNTALYTEHFWRTRVAFGDIGTVHNKYDRPYYDMFLAVRVLIDDVLVPDLLPTPQSLTQCTATILAHEATTTWINVPVILMGKVDHFTLGTIDLYRTLSLSFINAVKALEFYQNDPTKNTHTVRVEIVYGCKSENNFRTEYIARGAFKLLVDAESRPAVLKYEKELKQLIASKGNTARGIIPYVKDSATLYRLCTSCGNVLRYRCTICGAETCGSPTCVWATFVGYPKGCSTHKAQAQ